MIKLKLIHSVLIAEIIMIIFLYLFGKQGVPLMLQMAQENVLIEQEIKKLESTILDLEKNIKEWKTYPFYKEQVAREYLQMAREGENIYYLSNEKDYDQ